MFFCRYYFCFLVKGFNSRKRKFCRLFYWNFATTLCLGITMEPIFLHRTKCSPIPIKHIKKHRQLQSPHNPACVRMLEVRSKYSTYELEQTQIWQGFFFYLNNNMWFLMTSPQNPCIGKTNTYAEYLNYFVKSLLHLNFLNTCICSALRCCVYIILYLG